MQVILKIVAGPHGKLDRNEVSRLLTWIRPGESLTVGRSPAADMRIPLDRHLSGTHFRVDFDGRDCTLTDLKSKSGTLVNGEKVDSLRLSSGDVIEAGKTTFDVGFFGGALPVPDAEREEAVLTEDSALRIDVPEHGQAPAAGGDVMIVLTIQSGPFSELELANLTRRFTWIRPGERLVAGRSPHHAELAVRQDRRMSTAHFEVTCDGHIGRLRDLGSRNGTLLNGEPVEEAPLVQGDLIRAGDTVFYVGVHGEAESPDDVSESPSEAAEIEDGGDEPTMIPPAHGAELPSSADMRVVVTIDWGSGGGARLSVSRMLAWIGAGETLIVGRKPGAAEMVIRRDEAMADAHFEISCDGRVCRLRDLSGPRGTLVNGKPVVETLLRHGDVVRAGGTSFRVGVSGGTAVSVDSFEAALVPLVPEPADAGPSREEMDESLKNILDRLEEAERVISAPPPKRPPKPRTIEEARRAYSPDAAALQQRVAAGEALEGVALAELDLAGADLSGAVLRNCVFSEVDLSGANLAGADLRRSVFSSVKLAGADLSQSDLTGTTWSGVEAPGVNLRGAVLNQVIMLSDQSPITEGEPTIPLSEMRLPPEVRATVEGRGVIGASRRGCVLTGADLSEMRMQGARLEGVSLAGAKLEGAKVSGTTLVECDFSGADAGRAAFVDVQWEHGDLSEAGFKGARLDDCRFQKSRLAKVDFTKSKLRGVTFQQIDLSQGIVLPRSIVRCGFLGCDLSGRDFRGADLSQADFSESRLAGAQVKETRLRGAAFRKCELSGFDFQGANLAGTDFSDADLAGANLAGCNLTDARMAGARLEKADLSRAMLRNTQFTAADLTNARLADVVGDHVDFRQAKLAGASLAGARLSVCDLAETDLTASLFDATRMENCNLSGAALAGCSLEECELPGCNFSGANLQKAGLRGANLRQANFSGAKLKGAELPGAVAEAANFTGADLSGADLSGAKLRYANFEAAALEKADFASAVCDKGRFVAANLRGARCQAIDLRMADLTQADLTGADFSKAQVAGAKLHRAIEDKTKWSRADRKKAHDTDPERAAAEDFCPPPPEEPVLLPVTRESP